MNDHRLYSPRLGEALKFAAEAFRATPRKGSRVPYLTHLIAVAALVGENGGDEDQIIAAVLHDYLEDIQDSSADVLEEHFGPEVARMVEALSEIRGRPRPPWEVRKKEYLERLKAAPPRVKLISACDKLHNVRSVRQALRGHGEEVWRPRVRDSDEHFESRVLPLFAKRSNKIRE
ncbi:MAG: HD domain-containing protein, partial [Planctomycetota bacterium]